MQRDEISVREFVKLLGNQKKVIIGVTLACGLLAAVMSFFLEEVYETSTIIQVGSIYLPSDPTRQIKPELVEDPALLAEAINGGSFISDTLGVMGDMELNEYEDIEIEAEAFEYGRGRSILPMVMIYQESPDPAQMVEFLQKMANIIIERSRGKYEANIIAHEDSVKNAEEKIINLKKIINTKQKMRESINKHLSQETENLKVYNTNLEKIHLDEVKPMDLLFLQSSALNMNKLIENVGKIESDLIASIEENQALIGEYRDMMAIFKLRSSLSTPTRIIKSPILPRKPIKPKKILIVAIASMIGLIFSVSLIFIKHVIRT